ncbi:MAG: helix-turn-helix transcriptional regulator [Methanobrevibacter sp.]|nr:helix-turn-helix transcriptional regulator [Methanobrevibacter sp.]
MILTNKLKGLIAEKGLSQSDVAKEIGITPKTFYEKMKIGVFGSDEIEIMIELLDIDDPAAIFFAPKVTL